MAHALCRRVLRLGAGTPKRKIIWEYVRDVGACWVVTLCLAVNAGCSASDHLVTAELLARTQARESQTQIVLLGTGTPGAEPERSGPATAIVIADTAYLIDAGPGVVRQAARAMVANSLPALRAPNLRIAFLTHLHSDHTTGYPDLILAPWVLGRRAPLQVYGPPGTRAMTAALLEAYREDIRVRIEGPERLSPVGGTVDVTEVSVGVIHTDDQVQVEAFAVPHGIWDYAFGYKFTSKDRTIVISGDTGPFDGLVEIARGADVLVHEAYVTRGFNQRSAEAQRYHGTFHTSATKLGELATAADVGMVILYHQLHLGGESADEMVEEVRSTYDGSVVYGRDLDAF